MPSSITSIPKRYLWVAAGTVAALGAMYLRDRFGPQPGDRDDKRRDEKKRDDKTRGDGESAIEDAPSEPEDVAPGEASPKKELREFLAGDAWFDEAGWQGLWDREGVEDPKSWLKGLGMEVLKEQREKLKDHPALLAGCRRRFIVVARYAGIDVSDAAKLWSETDNA